MGVLVIIMVHLIWITMLGYQGVSCYNYKFYQSMMGGWTWEFAQNKFISRNETLLYMSKEQKRWLAAFIDSVMAPKINMRNAPIWTLHRTTNTTLIPYQRYYDDFPSDGFLSDNLADLLCVYTFYDVVNRTFSWEATKCKSPGRSIEWSIVDQNFQPKNEGLENKVTWMLYVQKTSQESAKNECVKVGKNLIRSLNTQNNNTILSELFYDGIWANTNVTTLWTDYKSKESITEESDSEFPEQTEETSNSSICVYIIVTPDYPPHPIKWATDSCAEGMHSFICENKTDELSLFRHSKMYQTGKVMLTTGPSSEDVCGEKCFGLRRKGVPCSGFNYNTKASTCSYFTKEDDIGIKELRQDWNTHEVSPITTLVKHGVITGRKDPVNNPSTNANDGYHSDGLITTDSLIKDVTRNELFTEITDTDLKKLEPDEITVEHLRKLEPDEITVEGIWIAVMEALVCSVCSTIIVYTIMSRCRQPNYEQKLDEADEVRDENVNLFTISMDGDDIPLNVAPVSYSGLVEFIIIKY